MSKVNNVLSTFSKKKNKADSPVQIAFACIEKNELDQLEELLVRPEQVKSKASKKKEKEKKNKKKTEETKDSSCFDTFLFFQVEYSLWFCKGRFPQRSACGRGT